MPLPELICACANLRRASRALTQLYDEELRPSGLRITQLTPLRALATVSEVGQGRLAQVMGIDSTTLTRTLGLLRKQGYVQILPGSDRRQRRLFLTEKGRSKVLQFQPHWERAQKRVREALGKDYEQLQGLLHRVALLAINP